MLIRMMVSGFDLDQFALTLSRHTSHFHLILFPYSSLEATKKATDYFKQKQYEQHHHRIHVPRSRVEKDSYLDSLTKFGQDDVASSHHGEHTHQDVSGGTAREYLDTLSEVRKSTWDDYKGQVEKAKEIKHDEVDCKSLYLCICLYLSSILQILTKRNLFSMHSRFEGRTSPYQKSPP